MAICLDCGFVSYPDRYKTKDEIIKYYENDYRSAPQIGNVYTGQRKLHYHSKVLTPVFNRWIETGNKKPVVSDIGAAFGMFQEGSMVFTVLAFIVIAAILYYYPQVSHVDWPLRLAMSMQLGGAVGNFRVPLTHPVAPDVGRDERGREKDDAVRCALHAFDLATLGRGISTISRTSA